MVSLFIKMRNLEDSYKLWTILQTKCQTMIDGFENNECILLSKCTIDDASLIIETCLRFTDSLEINIQNLRR